MQLGAWRVSIAEFRGALRGLSDLTESESMIHPGGGTGGRSEWWLIGDASWTRSANVRPRHQNDALNAADERGRDRGREGGVCGQHLACVRAK
jgi:hypothetical protein